MGEGMWPKLEGRSQRESLCDLGYTDFVLDFVPHELLFLRLELPDHVRSCCF
jgi:hypothetical protein